jgi:hypothetical protein
MAEAELVARVESLLERAESLPDAEARETATELARALLDLYGEGMARIVGAVAERDDGTLAAALAADELVSHLLVLHDLHPLDARARVEAVAARLGADVLAVEDGLARLRVRPSGCRSPATPALEQAVLAAAPEVERVEVELDERPLIPVESLTVRSGAR